MATQELTELELNEKTDRMAIKTKCPQCGDEYLYGVPYAKVPCRKCGISYATDFRQDIYTKKARQLDDKISEHPIGVRIKATESFKPALIHIRYNYMEQNCWEVSEIKKSTEEYRHCFSCGLCTNCYTCRKCGNAFERDKKRRKQRCPECSSNDFERTSFKKAKLKEKGITRMCPECNSDRIKLTLTKNKSKCHLCGSKNLSETKINIIYELIIKRKKAYRK